MRPYVIFSAAAIIALALAAMSWAAIHKGPVSQCTIALIAAEHADHNTGDQAGIRSSACAQLTDAQYLQAHKAAELQLHEAIP
jgi:hypothetical protein